MRLVLPYFPALAGALALQAAWGCSLQSRGEGVEEPDGSVQEAGEAGGSYTGGAGGSPSSGGKGGTSTAGAGGKSDGGSTGVGGAAGASPEECTNALDDDQDGKTDCADPECTAAFTCSDGVPATWEGFFRFRAAALQEAAPVQDCGWGAKASRYFAEPDSVALCEPCTCSNPNGFVCGPPHIRCRWDSDSCSGASAPSWDGIGVCKDLWNGFTSLHCQLTGTPAVVTTGSCTHSVSTYSNLELWRKTVDLCPHPFGAGCVSGACVPNPAEPYTGPLCILKSGIRDCPDAWPDRIILYSGGTDARSCSGCSCDPATVQCAGGTYTFYDSNGCTACSGTGCQGSIVLGPGPECMEVTDLGDGDDFSVKVSSPAQPVTGCKASGGNPEGMVVPLGERTLCCKAAAL